MTERWWDGSTWTDARRAEQEEVVPFYKRPWFLLLLALALLALLIWVFTRGDEESADTTTGTTTVDTTVPEDSATTVEAPTTTVVETTTTIEESTTTAAETTTTLAETTTTVEAEREPVFGDGLFEVGVDIAPGVYETGEIGGGFLGLGDGCTWQRLSDASGDEESILAERTIEGHEVIEIKDTDAYFDSSGCDEWFELEELDELLETVPVGTWVVGVHIAPGTYVADGGDDCTWERLSDASRDPDSVIESGEGIESPSVDVLESDYAFSSVGCGEWSAG
jgi:hypothetical protein